MKMENNWKQKSLENLEKKNEGTPSAEYANLINNVLRLRKITLNQFSIEDLRLMIGQHEGLIYLIPLAFDVLKDNLFAEGDFYPGDLLQNILNVHPSFWNEHKELWKNVNDLIKGHMEEITEHHISVRAFYDIPV